MWFCARLQNAGILFFGINKTGVKVPRWTIKIKNLISLTSCIRVKQWL